MGPKKDVTYPGGCQREVAGKFRQQRLSWKGKTIYLNTGRAVSGLFGGKSKVLWGTVSNPFRLKTNCIRPIWIL